MVATAETLSETKLCGSRRSTSTSSTPSVVKKSSSISSELGAWSKLIHKQAAEQEYPPRRKMVILLTPIPVVVARSRPLGMPSRHRVGRTKSSMPQRMRSKDPYDVTDLVNSVRTKSADWIKAGYTQTNYYLESNGEQWTVFRNPTTGHCSGAHLSSGW